MVRMRGLEPPRLAALEPKSSASTSSATSAWDGPLAGKPAPAKPDRRPARDSRTSQGQKTAMSGGVLFVHTNFPAQFRDLAQTLVARGVPCWAIGQGAALGVQ